MEPPRRRGRRLSGEEARLWGEIAKLITPLRARAVPTRMPAETLAGAPAPALPDAKTVSAKAKPSPKPSPKAPARAPETKAAAPASALPSAQKRPVKLGDLSPPAPARPVPPVFKPIPAAPGLERRERQRLQRGLLPIEARIDLHGLYQAEAHAALVGFLMRARASGLARVLVVTGKGGEASSEMFSERGVLRRSVPHWLRGPELRTIVLGFEEAGRQHGGAGALYVRLKRR